MVDKKSLIREVWLCSNKNCDSARYLDPGEENKSNCSFCNSKMIKTPLLVEEYAYITLISEDRDFIDAMIELKQKDIIEFKTKIAQFRAQVEQINVTEKTKKETTASQVRCPYCNSNNVNKISALSKSASIIGFGILSKKIGKQWHCNDCKSDF